MDDTETQRAIMANGKRLNLEKIWDRTFRPRPHHCLQGHLSRGLLSARRSLVTSRRGPIHLGTPLAVSCTVRATLDQLVLHSSFWIPCDGETDGGEPLRVEGTCLFGSGRGWKQL